MEARPGEGVVKEEKFPNIRKASHWWVCGESWNLTGQHNREGKKKIPQITNLTETPRGEIAQMLVSTTSKQGLNKEAWTALLRVRTRTECPGDNLRELT